MSLSLQPPRAALVRAHAVVTAPPAVQAPSTSVAPPAVAPPADAIRPVAAAPLAAQGPPPAVVSLVSTAAHVARDPPAVQASTAPVTLPASQATAAPPPQDAEGEDDALIMEELAIEFSPVGNGTSWTPRTPEYRGSPTPPPADRRPPTRRDVAVQVNFRLDHRDTARRRLHEDGTFIGHLRLVPEPEVHGDAACRDITTRVDLREQRRMCGCERCVRHATRLADEGYASDLPLDRGIQYATLPGVTLTNSTTPERRHLATMLVIHAERTFVVCSCTSCIIHRNLLSTWTTARRFAMPELTRRHPPEAGGCRERPRN